jgi:Reverse transcriptase (RNA-dependent DNA polymerase)
MTPKQNKYFGSHFKAKRGIQQGDIILPTIFNIIINAIIRATAEELKNEEKTTIKFYADDGFLVEENYKLVQQTLDTFINNFKKFGLIMNGKKVETMTMFGSKPMHQISDDSYHQQITQEGLRCEEIQQHIVRCNYYGEEIQEK